MLEAVPWENPTYGISGGAAGNVTYGGTVNPLRNRKGGAGNPPPTGARASALPDTRAGSHRLRLVVEDNGPGLAPELYERVFEPFYTTRPNGLGVGLAISRSLAESHGGRLWAESARGRGARFGLDLPYAEQDE